MRASQNVQELVRCIRLNRECADICDATADVLVPQIERGARLRDTMQQWHGGRARTSPGSPRRAGTRPRSGEVGKRLALAAALGVLAASLAGAWVFLQPAGSGGDPVAWSNLGTGDVHALAFDPADAGHLYFGHHGGLLESHDGGRSWQPTALRGADAMSVRASIDDVLQIAGHEVYLESTDGGASWQPVPNDLPGLDLHAFTVDPADADHAWAFVAGHGLFESTDRGRSWELLRPGNWGSLAAYRSGDATSLVALSEQGLQRSDDGGRTWQMIGRPGGQLATLAAAPDGGALYAGTTLGVERSTDGGATWSATAFDEGAAIALAVSSDGSTVAVVNDEKRFYRSPDGGRTWPGPDDEAQITPREAPPGG